MAFDVAAVRAQFPALNRSAIGAAAPVFFDNPAGTQVPERVIEAVGDYYRSMNANSGGAFATSERSDAMVQAVRMKLAAFLNAPNPDEIVIGPNMTTLNFALSRALAQRFKPGDEVIVTRMDHDANVAPWLRVAEERGMVVRWVELKNADCTLDLDSLEAALNEKTRLVATVHASNAAGTINPVRRIAEMAHAAGALHVVDAVQSAPHIPIDVQAIGCDFLLCSSYKFFGPHAGVLWGHYDLLADLPAYKVRPAKDRPPHRWETGTPAFELIAGLGAAIDYLASLGGHAEVTRTAIELGMAAIGHYERDLLEALMDCLQRLPGVRVYGITDPAQFDCRVPTVIFTLAGHTPRAVAAHLAQCGIYAWDGDYYAYEIMRALGHGEHGMVRVGLVHYNTLEEIERLEHALKAL